jgi:hypothetical protein
LSLSSREVDDMLRLDDGWEHARYAAEDTRDGPADVAATRSARGASDRAARSGSIMVVVVVVVVVGS